MIAGILCNKLHPNPHQRFYILYILITLPMRTSQSKLTKCAPIASKLKTKYALAKNSTDYNYLTIQ